MTNFDSIFLNKTERRLLKLFKKRDKINIQANSYASRSDLSTLLQLKLVKENATYNRTTRMDDYDGTASITKLGRDYLEYTSKENQNKWIPYIITTAISVAALIKSFMPEIASLLKLLTQPPQ